MKHLVTVGNITKRVSILMEGAEHKESFDQEERSCCINTNSYFILDVVQWPEEPKASFSGSYNFETGHGFGYLTSFLLFWQSQPDFICVMPEWHSFFLAQDVATANLHETTLLFPFWGAHICTAKERWSVSCKIFRETVCQFIPRLVARIKFPLEHLPFRADEPCRAVPYFNFSNSSRVIVDQC